MPVVSSQIHLFEKPFLYTQHGMVSIPTLDQAVQTTPEIRELMAEASPADLRTANERFRYVCAYLEHDEDQVRSAPVTQRTLRRWARSFHEAQASYGSGYVGLLPRTTQRGNRKPKAPEDSRTLLDTFIADHFETPRQKPAWEVYLAYQRECEAKCIIPLSARTFYRHAKQRSGYEQTKKRQGACVVGVMQHTGEKLPALPKGVPAPQAITTNYVVYIGSKQWKNVAATVDDPENVLIVEGFPQIDTKTGTIAVYVSSVTSKKLQAAKRQG